MKGKTMKKKSGLQFVIELDAEEAEDFRRRAKTKDPVFYEGIAKALVLGIPEVVDPMTVHDDIELLLEAAEFGRQGNQRASQDLADALSYTRQQLEKQPVKEAIVSWAVYYGDTLSEIANARCTPHTNQHQWAKLNADASSLTATLKRMIGRYA